MPLQRVCAAEMQARNSLLNGPRRAQSNVRLPHRVFCDVGTYVSCREYAVFRKEHGFAVNQGGTANKKVIIRPWQMVYFCQGFLFIKEKKKNEIQRNRLRYIS